MAATPVALAVAALLLAPLAFADPGDLVTPVGSAGLDDPRGSQCAPQVPLCPIDVAGDPAREPGNTTVYANEDARDAHANLTLPLVPPVSESATLDNRSWGLPLAELANETLLGPASARTRGAAELFLDEQGIFVGYEGPAPAVVSDPINGTSRRIYWDGASAGTDPNDKGPINYTQVRLIDEFAHSDTDGFVSGKLRAECEGGTLNRATTRPCDVFAIDTLATTWENATPDVVTGYNAHQASASQTPTPLSLAATTLRAARRGFALGYRVAAGPNDAALSLRGASPTDPALGRGDRTALGLSSQEPRLLAQGQQATETSVSVRQRPPGSPIAIVAAAAGAGALLTLLGLALYHRLTRNEALTQENRARLLDELRRNQRGATVAQLART
ncbi:MAG: hypothetical protein ACYDCK_14745, partial [Thermoplasmatota archaeon]